MKEKNDHTTIIMLRGNLHLRIRFSSKPDQISNSKCQNNDRIIHKTLYWDSMVATTKSYVSNNYNQHQGTTYKTKTINKWKGKETKNNMQDITNGQSRWVQYIM